MSKVEIIGWALLFWLVFNLALVGITLGLIRSEKIERK